MDGEKPKISGYAVVYYREGDPDTEFRMGSRYVERMMPGCLDRMFSEEELDVRGLFNHDPNHVLGRNVAGTLRLIRDDIGLRYEIDPPESRADIVESIERGDITGSSFAFQIQSETRVDDPDNNQIIYEVNDITRLQDVGPVTYPAYAATSTALRSDPRFEVEINHKPANVAEVLRVKEIANQLRGNELG